MIMSTTTTTATTATTTTTSTSSEDEAIRKFYVGKSVLVTGATGFIGKVLIEKLLYSCPELEKVYLLIRGSKGKSPQDRLIEMISQKPFTMRLKPEFVAEKLVAVESDLAEHKLGLSWENSKMLSEQVSLIFHVAASVKFEAPLEINMRHNVVATKELLELACGFKQLQCFVHVSTAYSNCQLRQIDERIYPMEVPADPMRLQVSKSMIDNRPNTYTYTKAMAENVASKYANRMNIVIVRPSIVMSSMKEPAEGWVDTINGPVGLSVLGALGILQKIKVNSEVVFDLIPVDIVTNALISIAWAATEKRSEFLPGSSPSLSPIENNNVYDYDNKSVAPAPAPAAQQPVAASSVSSGTSFIAQKIEQLGVKVSSKRAQSEQQVAAATAVAAAGSGGTKLRSNSNSPSQQQNGNKLDGTVRVFNLTTGEENPCSFYRYFSIGREEAYRKPSSKALRPLLTIPKQKGMNPTQYWIHKVFSHLLFAYIIDTLLSLFGQKRMVIKAVNRMHHANEMFDYFCSNQWTFVTDNVKRLRELQSTSDRETFDFDVRTINWNTYAQIGWLGCRRFILKESDETFGFAKRRYLFICLLYYVVKLSLILGSTLVANYCISSSMVMSMVLMPIYGVIYLL